jgi:DNA-binding transcriptional ArsR family regulator
MSLPAVSKHLKVLERAGLLEREIVGRVHHCRAVLEPLREAEDWIARRGAFWERGLDSLRSFLDGGSSAPSGKGAPSSQKVDVDRGVASPNTNRALAIVRRNPDGEWEIDRFLEDAGEPPNARNTPKSRR